MRLAAIVLTLLMLSAFVGAPVLAQAPAEPVVTSHVEKTETKTRTETTVGIPDVESIRNVKLKETANSVRDLVGFLVAVGTVITGAVAAGIKGWRVFKEVLDAHEKRTTIAAKEVAATAVTAAARIAVTTAETAAETAATMQQVQSVVEATAAQLTDEGDSSLRSIVQRHTVQLQEQMRLIESHGNDAVRSRKEILEMLTDVKKQGDFLNKTVTRVLAEAYIDKLKHGTPE